MRRYISLLSFALGLVLVSALNLSAWSRPALAEHAVRTLRPRVVPRIQQGLVATKEGPRQITFLGIPTIGQTIQVDGLSFHKAYEVARVQTTSSGAKVLALKAAGLFLTIDRSGRPLRFGGARVFAVSHVRFTPGTPVAQFLFVERGNLGRITHYVLTTGGKKVHRFLMQIPGRDEPIRTLGISGPPNRDGSFSLLDLHQPIAIPFLVAFSKGKLSALKIGDNPWVTALPLPVVR